MTSFIVHQGRRARSRHTCIHTRARNDIATSRTLTYVRSPFVYGCHRCTRLLFDVHVPHATRHACRLATRLATPKTKRLFGRFNRPLERADWSIQNMLYLHRSNICPSWHRSHSAFHFSHVSATYSYIKLPRSTSNHPVSSTRAVTPSKEAVHAS